MAPAVLDSVEACYNLGYSRRKGRGVPKDETIALAAFKKGCTLGDADACRAIGVK